MQAAHQAREFTEAAFGPRPAGRQDFGLEDDLGIGDVGEVDRLALCQLDGRAAQAAQFGIGDLQVGLRDRVQMLGRRQVPRIGRGGVG